MAYDTHLQWVFTVISPYLHVIVYEISGMCPWGIRRTPNEDASWREHLENVQTVPFAGFILIFIILRISYLERKTNDWVRSKINFLMGPQEPLLATVKRRKLAWFGHITRHDNLCKTILQGTLEGGRPRDRQMKCWMSKSGHPCPCQNCSHGPPAEKRISVESSLISPRRPSRSRD